MRQRTGGGPPALALPTLALVALVGAAAAPAVASGDPDGSPAEDPEPKAASSGKAEGKRDKPSPKAAAPEEGGGKAQGDDSENRLQQLAGGAAAGGAWPFGMSASLTQSMGQGTFIPYKRWNPSFVTQATLTPQMRMFGLTFFASETVSFEWTRPDNMSGQRFSLLGDPSVGMLKSFRIAPIWLTLQVSGGARAGLSRSSRATGVIGGVFGGLNAFWSTPIGISVFGSARVQGNAALPQARGFFGLMHAPKQTTLGSGETVQVGTCLARAGEDPQNSCAGIPSLAQGSGSLGIAYSIWRFTFSASTGMLAFIPAYFGPNDEYTSPNAFVGPYPSALTFGSLRAMMNIWGPWNLSVGTFSFQPILTSDGRFPRFPMWDFISPANNFSSVFVATNINF